MRVFKSKWFNKWARKEGLMDTALIATVKELNAGLYDADLGGHVYKKRTSIHGVGKSGGLRTLLAFKINDKAFFMYGFAKNQRDNISSKELSTLKKMAKELLSYDVGQLEKAIASCSLFEVKNDE